MRIAIFGAILWLVSAPAHADTQTQPAPPVVIIQQTDPDYPAEQLAGPSVQVRKLSPSDSTSAATSKDPRVAPPKQRNQWLSESDLTDFTSGWDEFAKDELVIRAQILKSDQFKSLYPKADPRSLAKLQSIIEKERK